MAILTISNLTQSGSDVDVELTTDVGDATIFAVRAIYVLFQGGPVDRYSDDNGLIRVHTDEEHHLSSGEQVVIERSQALEANGTWRIRFVSATGFSLKGSRYKGNNSAGDATWNLVQRERMRRATLDPSGVWKTTLRLPKPGNYQIVGEMTYSGSHVPFQTDPETITVS